MGQLQKVSWRTVGYAALGTVFAAASVVAIINSDGVRPTSLTSSAATRWLFDQVSGNAVLVDGLAGRVVAKVDAETPHSTDVAVQGVGGAFLVAKEQGSVRTISTAKLQLGTAQPVASLLDPDVKFGVGASGLTVVSSKNGTANVVAVGDNVARPVTIPKSDNALVAADGSMWLLNTTLATHVNVDSSASVVPIRSPATNSATVGARAVTYDNIHGILHWLGGGDVDVRQALPNPTEAVLQQSGDDASCVWLASGDTLTCVGPTKVERTVPIAGLGISTNDKLAVAGDAAVIVRGRNQIERIDLENQQMAEDQDAPTVRAGASLTITASGNLIWLDDQGGNNAWVVHRFGINTIDKDDALAPLLDAQGQVKPSANGGDGPTTGNGNAAGQDNTDHLDPHVGQEDPPHATPDSVTARAGATVTIPVTGNDWDPDGDPFAVSAVGAVSGKSAGSGTVDILDGNSISYLPNPGFSGGDTFMYTIIDDKGQTATAMVTVELFPPGSPNRPPVAQPDKAFTRVGHPITIDVLANDIDPERDTLSVAPFRQDVANISDDIGPTNLPALKYVPPDSPGNYEFTYQAVDPQGGTSVKTPVSVIVSAADAHNSAPVAHPDAIRLRVGDARPLNVKANDTDPDGDDMLISLPNEDVQPKGVSVELQGQQLLITLQPAAPARVVVQYILSDLDPTHTAIGKVLVLRIDDTAPNRPPVANPDADRVVIGNSVKIPVTANDVDPEHDVITVLSASDPVDGSGTAVVEGNFIRFKPILPNIKEPTTVTFTYKITDGHSNEAIGRVTVTVLLEALPQGPSARDDFADTETDKPVTINVLANDTDPSGAGPPHLTDNPVCAGGGEATRTPDDRVTFTPPRGQIGTFGCTYTVSNNQGFRAQASIIVTVTEPPPGNGQPTINQSAMQLTVSLGKAVTLNANALASDPDGDNLVFSAVSTPSHGRTDFTSQSSTFTYFAPSAGTASPTPDADNIDVTISDGHNGNDHGTITIKLVDDTPATVPPAPPKTVDISTVATTGVPLLFDVIAELRDANIGDTLTLVEASADSGPGTAQA
ncbi:MAG: tandem-95 repeat protein, partial [Ilumatobacteraceae bacterium]|nr:tandem-95 repeat protein [Ilumatobacteraceae bacterium]